MLGVELALAKEWSGAGQGVEGLGMWKYLGYGEASSPIKAFCSVVRPRITGIVCLLVPWDLQGLGNASTPNLPFCQVAFLLT